MGSPCVYVPGRCDPVCLVSVLVSHLCFGVVPGAWQSRGEAASPVQRLRVGRAAFDI